MPEIIILAGPNGAGKSTFAEQFQRDYEDLLYVNADQKAAELARRGVPTLDLDVAAARLMLCEIELVVEARQDLMIETTLASLSYARKIPGWKATGYHIGLVYLRLSSAEDSIARVAARVARGGHGIPAETIRRRFTRSLANLDVYKNLVNEWYVCDSIEGAFPIVEAWNE
ncbi:MAG TPA: zeta toxin family protein [Vitreimonas sp.]|uniref:zeta toxin family protein n=1 Tax=Vitreimonas sp. TaxID=3069702 RepID=UPI002D26AF41|nr:zeta toxin family protein [Vitreimonas sp.]HYD89803.1 zeta toxin family protein [Vitreimonas sp.]